MPKRLLNFLQWNYSFSQAFVRHGKIGQNPNNLRQNQRDKERKKQRETDKQKNVSGPQLHFQRWCEQFASQAMDHALCACRQLLRVQRADWTSDF